MGISSNMSVVSRVSITELLWLPDSFSGRLLDKGTADNFKNTRNLFVSPNVFFTTVLSS